MANLYRDPRSTITIHHDTYPYIYPSKFRGALKGKVILLTGAGRGIGRASALACAAAGANVACISRTLSDTLSLVEEISQKGYPRAIAIAADVGLLDTPERVVREVQEELGPVDVLINNAGISRISDVEHERDMGAAMKIFEVNVQGALGFIHRVIPSMMKRKSGVIINVGFSKIAIVGALEADEPIGRFRSCHHLSSLLLGLQFRESISDTRNTYYGSRISAPWHLFLRCTSMHEFKYDVGPRRTEFGSSRKGGGSSKFYEGVRA